jgi:prepilin-type N-terminal cleavage/methylation domain-containing protein
MRNLPLRSGTAQRGFTLLEAIMVIVALGILGTIGARLMASGFNTYLVAREISEDAGHGTLAIERITRELRTIRSATAADLNIAPAVPAKITFVDVDGNTITYGLSGGSITRTLNGGTALGLADHVTSLTFDYLQDDGVTTAATSTAVYYVTVTLAAGSTNAAMTFRSTVKPTSF